MAKQFDANGNRIRATSTTTQPPAQPAATETPPTDTQQQEQLEEGSQEEVIEETTGDGQAPENQDTGSGEQEGGGDNQPPENQDTADNEQEGSGEDQPEESVEDTTPPQEPEGASQQLADGVVVQPLVPDEVLNQPIITLAPIPQVAIDPQVFQQAAKEQYSVDEQQLIEFFQDYATKMAKGRPVSPADIATNQVGWFRKVMILLELEPKTFRRVMDYLMANIVENIDSAYHPARRMRGMTAPLRLTDRERVQFQMLMQVFCDMADPLGRDAMRSQTSAEKALGNGLTETARSRLSEYFRLG